MARDGTMVSDSKANQDLQRNERPAGCNYQLYALVRGFTFAMHGRLCK